jgi:hypothetical protein
MMGHSSVERPRRVSTAFNGELGIDVGELGNRNGLDVG